MVKLQKQLHVGEQKLMTKAKIEGEIEVIIGSYDEITSSESIQEDITYLQQYGIQQKRQEKRRGELSRYIEEDILSVTYNNFQKDIEKLYKKLCILRENSEPLEGTYDEEKLRSIVDTQKNIK